MSKKQSKTDSHNKQPARQAKKPDLTAEQLEELARLAAPAADLTGAPGENTIQTQAAALKDARFPVVRRQKMAAQIGRLAGNHYLQRVMSVGEDRPQADDSAADHHFQQRTPFSAHIARVPESESGQEENQPEEEEERIVTTPITAPEPLAESSLDSISATIKHKPTVNPGGAAPSGFGITRAAVAIENTKIKSASNKYTVTGDLVHTITWKVRASLGPANQKDIASENDADITAANYTTVASDLKPDMSDLGGRPPRTKFWAKDLTKRHELVHAKQRKGKFGDDCAAAAQKYLDGQTASSAAYIENTLLRKALSVGVKVYNALVELPSTEEDAYADGAPTYKARSKAIKKKGKKGEYN